MHLKHIGAVIAALLFLACFCSSCTSSTEHLSANDNGCGFTPYKPLNKTKKVVVHPAPTTPIGGNYNQY